MSTAGDGRVAVVDLGSNSVRLLLCEGLEDGAPRGERVATVTGLRRGADPDGRVADDALARLDECLARYADLVREAGSPRVVCVGTSAVREAPNRDAVEAVVRARLGARLRALTGEEEAALAFAGAALADGGPGPRLVIDVGGGSTELVRGGPEGPHGSESLPLGAVRQTERHLREDPPDPAALAALRAEARGLIEPALARIGGPAPAVGVAGTATSLAAIEIGAYDPRRVHGHPLSRAAVDGMIERLAAMPLARRRETPGLDPARAGVIVGGATILAAALEAAGLDAMTVSERDILDGVAMAALGAGPGAPSL